jgi:hypothetical protein
VNIFMLEFLSEGASVRFYCRVHTKVSRGRLDADRERAG